MNKKIYMLILSAAVIAASGSMVWAAGETEATETEAVETEAAETEADASKEEDVEGEPETDLQELTQKIRDANTMANYAEKYGSATLEQKGYDENGNVSYEELVYADAERFAFEAEGEIQIFDNTDEPQCYGFHADSEKPFKYSYLDKTVFQKALNENRNLKTFVFSGEERLITDEITEEGRKLVLETDAEDVKQIDPESQIKDGEIQREEIFFDPETFILSEYKSVIVSADGGEIPYWESKVTPKAEKYELDEAVAEQIESQDTRTVKLVLDPGTENEQEYSSQVAKGCIANLLLPEGYDTVYDDEECTQIHESPKEFDSDVVLYSKFRTDEEVLKELADVNSLDRLVEEYGSIGVNGLDYLEGGEEKSYFYADAGRYAWDNSTTGQIDVWDTQGEKSIVGYSAESQRPMVGIYIDEARFEEAAAESRMDGTFIYMDGEKIVSNILTEDDRLIATEMTSESLDAEDAELLEDGEVFHTEYLLDPKTLFIKEIKVKAVSSDGEERMLREQTMTAGAEKYELPAEYQTLLDAEDTRTFTIVKDPGTAEEQTISKEVAKGCMGVMFLPDGYQIYDDKECTKVHEPFDEYENDQTLYFAKEKE